jgi:hypothetical protein
MLFPFGVMVGYDVAALSNEETRPPVARTREGGPPKA